MIQSILNFRDVGESIDVINKNKIGVIKKGLLFRSADPDNATEEDIKQLLNFDIHTIVDLRAGGHEHRHESQLRTSFPNTEYPFQHEDNVNPIVRKTININVMGNKLLQNYIARAPFYIRVQIYVYYLIFQQRQAAIIMAQYMSPRGLTGMYTDLFDASDEEICKILEIMTDKANLPILIHCKHGKDRTGVIIAIILSICGVDDETIVQDYASSQEGLASIHSSIVDDMKRLGLTEEFATVSPDVMRNTLIYVKEKYGSIQDYLIGIGFDLDKQKLIQKNFLI
ncbi:protein-tyrosine phosphatase-like protein [Gigaspora rosea]|uniref:Protein-tyrosine phosphatase-like protein n=1 Tax=Gigaspora rosea TaxID=44941 RepID=A0A397U7M0_9GLOM|nr:protein-tyrosine phosphatase-like protein [Gigaspora rosea]